MSRPTLSLPEKELDRLAAVLAFKEEVTHEAGVCAPASGIPQEPLTTLCLDLASAQRGTTSADQPNIAWFLDPVSDWGKNTYALHIFTDWKRMSVQESSTKAFRPPGRIGSLLDYEIGAIRDQYWFYDDAKVEGFLGNNSDLVPLLFEAIYPIRKHFGTAQLKLRYSEDPEGTGDNYLELAIITDEPVDTALEKLEAFDRYWWLEAGKDESRLIIDIEIE